MSTLSTICYGVCENKGYILSDKFWSKLNVALRNQLQQRTKHDISALTHKKEQLEIIEGAIEANKNLDDSLLSLLK